MFSFNKNIFHIRRVLMNRILIFNIFNYIVNAERRENCKVYQNLDAYYARQDSQKSANASTSAIR